MEEALEEADLLLGKVSEFTGFEPTLKALKGFPELENGGGLLTVGEEGTTLSRSSVLPNFSNMARAL